MSQWFDRVGDLLYDGESVESRVDVGEGGVVVTSHRVLVFTPDDEGANYQYADRPNVGGVTKTARGDPRPLQYGIQALVLGGMLAVAGQVVSLDSLVSGTDLHSGTGQLGIGGMLGMIQTLLDLLAMLDEILTVLGALGLLLGALLLGAYLWSRERLLVIDVAGGEDITMPAPDDDGILDRLDRAVRPGPVNAADHSVAADTDPLTEADSGPRR